MPRTSIAIALSCFAFSAAAHADVRLPAIFASGMVIQRETEAPVWGWGDPGEAIVVRGSWPGAKMIETKAEPDGRWSLKLPTFAAGGPYIISVAGKNTITLENVMVGEVWICSGQSNMEWPVSASMDAEQEIAAADYPLIRQFDVPNRVAAAPEADCKGSWAACSPKTAAGFTAVGLYFGRELHKKLNVPIGLINATWGGTVAEAWCSDQTIGAMPDFAEALAAVHAERNSLAANDKPNPNRPTVLYNGMVAPVRPYAARGAIWYQGESNRGRGEQYRSLFPALIADWRREWARQPADFPFYFVQIAPYRYGGDSGQTAELREAQMMTMAAPNTGMAVTMDIGNPGDIHPTNKQEVGRRLALWALAKTYGQTGFEYCGPIYKSMKVEGSTVRIEFDHAEGLMAKDGDLSYFDIAGTDGKFTPATAVIDGNTVVVSSPSVPTPTAARYAWDDDCEPNLFNGAGLPASPFRTNPPAAK